ncbi:MAG: hypothetical protein IPL54_13115 [Chitinophagaceae bacterium]|nr:hypothetical protein [Chitinophagaceae bacterium]
MIIVKLLVADKELGNVVANSILKNKFTLNVFGSPFDSFHVSSSNETEQTAVYVIQFVTKSLLFNEIEESLKKEFPETEFYICATPIVHMAINLHDKIRERVIGAKLNKIESEA